MLKTETYTTRGDGVVLKRTWSDAGMKLRQKDTGILYDEAVDPETAGRIYEETDFPVETGEEDA